MSILDVAKAVVNPFTMVDFSTDLAKEALKEAFKEVAKELKGENHYVSLFNDGRRPDSTSQQSDCKHRCGSQPMRHDEGEGGHSSKSTISGTASIEGDPHVKYNLTQCGGEAQKGQFTTKGGAGQEINLLDTDNLDISGDFESWKGRKGVTVVGSETITANGDKIEIDAKSDTITLNGHEIQDGTSTVNGNCITKRGDTVTIKTADGQTITVKDKGNYLDTSLDLKNLSTEHLGGMLGDAAKGNQNADASDYAMRPEHASGESCDRSQGDDGDKQQSSEWAADLLRTLAKIPGLDPAISNMLGSLANLIGNQQDQWAA
jgi:hypothetical protein